MKKNKYAYDIDTVQAGDKIAVYCSHGSDQMDNDDSNKKTKQCQRFLVMTVDYPSTMQCTHPKFGSFDMRNQSWYCHSHKS